MIREKIEKENVENAEKEKKESNEKDKKKERDILRGCKVKTL